MSIQDDIDKDMRDTAIYCSLWILAFFVLIGSIGLSFLK